MVVTSFFRFSLFILSSLIFLQDCAVDLNSNTPGALAVVCTPTPTQITAFQPIMANILQTTANVGAQQGCGNCHVSGVGAGSFRILAGSTDQIVLANYCTAVSRLNIIAVHPTEPSHAQVYTSTDLSQLSAWVASVK